MDTVDLGCACSIGLAGGSGFILYIKTEYTLVLDFIEEVGLFDVNHNKLSAADYSLLT